MATKTKMISVNAIDKVIKDSAIYEHEVDWHGNTMIVKRNLSLEEVAQFVAKVVDGCFLDDDEGYIEYYPEVKNFLINITAIEMYSNLRIPTKVEKQYDIIYNTDALDVVRQYINQQQMADIYNAIEQKIDYLLRVDIQNAQNRVKALYNSISKIESDLSKTYSNVTPDDVIAFMDAVENNKIDEEKLMQSYFKISEQKESEKLAGGESKIIDIQETGSKE